MKHISIVIATIIVLFAVACGGGKRDISGKYKVTKLTFAGTVLGEKSIDSNYWVMTSSGQCAISMMGMDDSVSTWKNHEHLDSITIGFMNNKTLNMFVRKNKDNSLSIKYTDYEMLREVELTKVE